MSERLPPLNSLRAFEAGARHLSFTRAAAELNVTQAAVSHQVKLLEDDLGVKLFRRMTRRLALTEAGNRLYPVVGEVFERLSMAIGELRAGSGTPTLTVSLTPSFSSKWLISRLGRFWENHPEVDIRLHHSTALVDFRRDDVDLAVRWGAGTWRGLVSECVLEVELTPICSPALVVGERPLRDPAQLADYTLFHEDDYGNWTQWLAAAGAANVNPRRGPIMDDLGVLLEAVAAGRGVALGRLSLIKEDLASGRLVRPFETSLKDVFSYYLVYPSAALERPEVKAFRDFLLAEAAREKS